MSLIIEHEIICVNIVAFSDGIQPPENANQQRKITSHMAIRTIPELTDSDKKRFWAKVNKNGPVIRLELGPCWVWTASCHTNGHGAFGIRDAVFIASRVSLAIRDGCIPSGFQALHKCDNPPCVNPSHLFVGTTFDNMRDMVIKRRNRSETRPDSYSGYKCGPINPSRGENRYNSKMTEEKIREIRRLKSIGQSSRSLALKFGICHSTAKQICNRKAWKHVS